MMALQSLLALALLACPLSLAVAKPTDFEQPEFRLPIGPLLARQLDQNTNDYYLGYKKPSDFDTPWAKYYNDTFPKISPQFRRALTLSPFPASYGIKINASGAALNKPGYLDLEDGFAHLDDGSVSLAIRTDAPENLTGEMLDWWFSWHTNDTRKYKLWNPNAHQYAVLPEPLSNEKKSDCPTRDRYINVTSFVDEYIGPTAYKLSISFYEPSQLGFSTTNPSTGVEALVSAFVSLLVYADLDGGALAELGFTTLSVVLVHQLRKKPGGGGNEFRSRFWFGKDIAAATGLVVPGGIETIATDLGKHCYHEMSHLATFLPKLYEEFKDNVPTGY